MTAEVPLRYHINPATGRPNICRAKKKPCKYGSAPHYDSKEAARAGYEQSQAEHTVAPTVSRVRVTLDEGGYLSGESEALAAPRDVYCPHCDEPTSARAASRLLNNDEAICPGCGVAYDLTEAEVTLTPENPSYRFLHKDEVLRATWYHATNRDDWLEEIDDYGNGLPFEAHVGTEAAAFDRAIAEYAMHGHFSRSFYLYEVSLAPYSEIADDVAEDENGKLFKDENSESDVVRYINRWEDMASISLAVKHDKLRILSKRLVSPDEARQRITPYNVRPDSLREDEELPEIDTEENPDYRWSEDDLSSISEDDEAAFLRFEESMEQARVRAILAGEDSEEDE